MPSNKYSDFLELNPSFESVVDIKADERNKNLWREYIVGEDMENTVDRLCKSIGKEEPDSQRSFWIEGTYGTGKSYGAVLVKHLLEEPADVVDDFLARNSRLAAYRNRFMKIRRRSDSDYLLVWHIGCTGVYDGTALLMALEKDIRAALYKKFGDKADYGEASLRDAVLQQVYSPMHNWEYILENSMLGDSYDSVEMLKEKLEAGDLDALRRTAEVIRQNNWGLIDSLESFQNWIRSVIINNKLTKTGIFVIWDEFTEYVANSDDHTLLQQLSEFTKVQPFYMYLIVHRTMQLVESLTEERYNKISDRFHTVEYKIHADACFDLIAGSMLIRNGMSEHWKDARKSVVADMKRYLPEMSNPDDKVVDMIDRLCPMHPMTIRLLSRVAQSYAAAQRTMFRFMKDTSDQEYGFAGYINKEGPDSQACWLTPDWLWDYFFRRESDFKDKNTKAAEYIRHFEESLHLVENDENATRVFKTAMLLLALMVDTKGIYSGRRTRDGISATKACLQNCLAGVINPSSVEELLQTMVDARILVLDQAANGTVRLQLPFRGTSESEISAKIEANKKKYTRYTMFSKDGAFASELEKQAWDENDASFRRMKIAACCAETQSINNRLEEIKKELEKYPHKLGLLIVNVCDENQAKHIQSTLQEKSISADEPRLVIALSTAPLREEQRVQWLTAITKQEMANESGNTGSIAQYKIEAGKIIASWVGDVKTKKMYVYNGTRVYSNIYGLAQLNQRIRSLVLDECFEFAPEHIVLTNTAYRSCNDSAPLAGVQRKSANSQLNSVLNSLRLAGLLELNTIDAIINAKKSGNKQAICVAALAEVVKREMDSGSKVRLGELWTKLQQSPFGYYNSIACGILLGFVMSCYKNSKYTWTDSAQSTHHLNETTVAKMVTMMCAGKMSSDYLSAGSITWQHFSEYMGAIFHLPIEQLADQATGYHNMREAVAQSGSPFWVLKYLPKTDWNNEDHRQAADKIIDNIQLFIAQDGDVEKAMDETLQLFNGRGKMRAVLSNAFRDKNVMAATLRSFLFAASPELKEVATRLSIQPQELHDRICAVMQASTYTWTEEQVKAKLVDVTSQYKYLEAIGKVQGTIYHSIEAAKKDLRNLFDYLRIPMSAISEMNQPWYAALQVFDRTAHEDVTHMSVEERESAILILEEHGVLAKDCLTNGKPVLEDILARRNIECSNDELSLVYNGLKGLHYDATLTQFNKELDAQIGKISFSRNKSTLLETWRSLTGEESIKAWCNTNAVPLMWIIPKDFTRAFNTLLDVQCGGFTNDAAVVSAINAIQRIDTCLLVDKGRIQSAFMALIGSEYAPVWEANRDTIIAQAKIKLGNDMSEWTAAGLSSLLGILKDMQQKKAKREQLVATKDRIRDMNDKTLRAMVIAFLEERPEFCDKFSK